MSAWDSPIVRISTGQLNTVNDTVVGGQANATITPTSRFSGQLGRTVWFSPDMIGAMFDSAVGTLYGGRYRYVRMREDDDDSPTLEVGSILFWDTTVTNWQTLYQVTRDETLSSVDDAVMIAGIYLGGFAPGNYGFIQDLGMVPVLFRGTLTTAGAIGSRVFAAGAGAGADNGLADVLTTDSTSLANARYLGNATTAPAAATLSPVLLGFHNIIG